MNAVQGQLLTSGAASTDIQIVLTDVSSNEEQTFFLKVVSGTIKYGRGSTHASAHGWASSDTVLPIRCKNGELYVNAAADTDTFVVTACP